MNFNLLPWRQSVLVAEKRCMRLFLMVAAGAAILTGIVGDMLISANLQDMQNKVQELQHQIEARLPDQSMPPARKSSTKDLLQVLPRLNMYGICLTSLVAKENVLQIEGRANQADGVLAYMGAAHDAANFSSVRLDSLERDKNSHLFQFKLSAPY